MMEEEHVQPPPHKGLRAILRIILYVFSVFVLTIIVGVPVVLVLFLSKPPQEAPTALQITLPLLAVLYLPLSAAIVAFTGLFVVYVDHRPFETLGFDRIRHWTTELWLGIGLGIGMPALIFAASYLAGWTKIAGSLITQPPSHILSVALQSVIAMVGIAIVEETVMRGYVLQTLKWGYDPITALIASSVAFGAMHLFNPGATFAGFLGTTAAGLFLGYCYLATKRLWLPIGVHFGWNFALGPIFGFPVSGIDIPSWIVQKVSGPTIWTGGAFGPEAGLMTLAVLLLGVLVVRCSYKHLAPNTQHRSAGL